MSQRNKEYPVIGMRPISIAPRSNEQKKFKELWTRYEPKVRKTVSSHAIPGAVGADYDDLIEHGQDTLLQAIRTHDPKRGHFSTHFYTLLHNHLKQIKRVFPKRRFLITGINHLTKKRIRTRHMGKGRLTEGELCFGIGNLEARLQQWRNAGYHLAVKEVTPEHRRGTIDQNLSIDYQPDEENRDEVNVSIRNTLREQRVRGLSETQIISLIHQTIEEERLQKITLLLFSGHKASGNDGIMKQLGLKRFQYERDLQRIRMLLGRQFSTKNS